MHFPNHLYPSTLVIAHSTTIPKATMYSIFFLFFVKLCKKQIQDKNLKCQPIHKTVSKKSCTCVRNIFEDCCVRIPIDHPDDSLCAASPLKRSSIPQERDSLGGGFRDGHENDRLGGRSAGGNTCRVSIVGNRLEMLDSYFLSRFVIKNNYPACPRKKVKIIGGFICWGTKSQGNRGWGGGLGQRDEEG